MEASYRAAEIATKRRSALLAAGKSFATETVFSHASKLEIITEAKERGYIVIVMHVGVEGLEVSVARVLGRAEEGGHAVPEDKIRAHYDRGQSLIRKAVLWADRGMAFDNSPLNTPPRLVLLFSRGRLAQVDAVLPAWVLDGYAEDIII